MDLVVFSYICRRNQTITKMKAIKLLLLLALLILNASTFAQNEYYRMFINQQDTVSRPYVVSTAFLDPYTIAGVINLTPNNCSPYYSLDDVKLPQHVTNLYITTYCGNVEGNIYATKNLDLDSVSWTQIAVKTTNFTSDIEIDVDTIAYPWHTSNPIILERFDVPSSNWKPINPEDNIKPKDFNLSGSVDSAGFRNVLVLRFKKDPTTPKQPKPVAASKPKKDKSGGNTILTTDSYGWTLKTTKPTVGNYEIINTSGSVVERGVLKNSEVKLGRDQYGKGIYIIAVYPSDGNPIIEKVIF